MPPIILVSSVSSSMLVMVSCQASAVRSPEAGSLGTAIILRSASASSSVQPLLTISFMNMLRTSGVVTVQSILPLAR